MSTNPVTDHLVTLETLPQLASQDLTPTSVDVPSFLMNVPFSYNTDIPNNVWMQDLVDHERRVNKKVAMRQFLALYNFISSRALVHLLPTPEQCDLQDLVFTANLGIVPVHLDDKPQVILSNFSSPPRMGEPEIGENFFKALGYTIHHSPHKFEGEAELKHLHHNVYIGGYGERSQEKSYEWMEAEFDMEIVKLRLTDPYLYHLDCTIFPISREKTMVCTEMFSKAEVTEIEKHTEIIDVSRKLALPGICNSLRVSNCILNGSNVHELQPGTEKHRLELDKDRALLDIAAELGFEVNFFNLGEFLKGGAALSCMVMHLNRVSYNFSLM